MDRVESEERPANESPVPAALSDPGVASPEKTKVKKRRMSFKKLRSNAQKLIPRRKKNENRDNRDGPDAEQSSTELLSEPSLPPAAPSAPSSPTLTVSSELVTSSESIPAATQQRQHQSKESLKSDEKVADEPNPRKKTRKPSRAASFMKKLTGRKAKVAPNLAADNEVDTSGGTLETPLSIKRSTPEGATLSISETSLYDEPDQTSDDQVKILQLDAEPKAPVRAKVATAGALQRRTGGDTAKASSGFQLPSPQRAAADTVQPSAADNGGGPPAGVGEPTARSSATPTATDAKPISAERSPTTAGLVTAASVPPDFGESSTSPTSPVPAPNLSRAYIAEIDKLSVDNVTGSQAQVVAATIRDKFFQSVTAGSAQETFMRAPQETQQQQQQGQGQPSTVRTQEAARPYQLGNNLRNPNNGGNFETAPDGTPAQDAIVFDIGTKVRPDRTSTIKVTTTTLTPLAIAGATERALSGSKSVEVGVYDGDDRSKTPDGDGSFASDFSRRRLAYVAQPTFYTPEEEELIVAKPSLVSSVTSDYSLESDDYLENKMSPHGDLLLEKADGNAANTMNAAPAEKREHLYKILVIGELGTGKTSFIKRYVHQFFSQNYRATIGVDFALKVLNWDQNTIIRLQLWDIAGQERFGNMTRVYYKEAVGAFIVFDVTRSATFDAVIKWKQDLDSKVQLPDGKPIPCILLANKSDQQKQGIVATPAKLDEYVKEHGFAGWFETSAKENINIEEAAKSLVNKILMNDKAINAGELMDSERFALAGGQLEDTQKKSCAC